MSDAAGSPTRDASPSSSPRSKEPGWDLGLLAVAGSFLLWLARVRPFRGEEIEHVHAAWRVAQGAVPYRDFFEHHHPLLWYVLGAALPWVGESSATILWARMGLVLLGGITLALTGRLAYEATGSRRTARFAALLLVSTLAFVETHVAVRPDVPMVASATLAVLLALRALRRRSRIEAAAAGIALGVAFCFLQKVVLLVPALTVATATRRWVLKRDTSMMLVAWFAAGFLAVAAAGGALLWATGGLDDYVWTNWVFNGIVSAELARIPTTGFGLVINLPFWTLTFVGSAWALARHRRLDGLVWLVCVALTLLASLVATRALRWHYVLQMMPMAAVIAAWALERALERQQIVGARRRVVIVAIVLIPIVSIVASLDGTNQRQRAAIDYVLTHSQEGEPMFDPAIAFNLFRPDLHYYGELPTDRRRVSDWCRRAAGDRYREYDPCVLLRAKRPRFVSDVDDQLRVCGQRGAYGPTGFEGLYVRVD